MRPDSASALRRSTAVVAALIVGGACAVGVAGGPPAAAEDIPVYTSTTPDVATSSTPEVVTSTTPEVVTSTTPEVVTAPTVDPFKAAEIEFYKSTQIKKLPPAPSIRRLPSRGWTLSVPAHCTALCVYAGTLIARNIGIWYSDGYAFSAHASAQGKRKQVTLGTVKVTGNGDLSPKLAIRPKFRRSLLRARRSVQLTLTRKVTDSRYGFVTERTQEITLRPGRR